MCSRGANKAAAVVRCMHGHKFKDLKMPQQATEAERCYTALSCQAGCTRAMSPCFKSAGHAQPQRPVSQRHWAFCHSGSSWGQQSSCEEGRSYLQGRAHCCGRERAVRFEGSLRIPQGMLVGSDRSYLYTASRRPCSHLCQTHVGASADADMSDAGLSSPPSSTCLCTTENPMPGTSNIQSN